ncbi:MAG: protein bugT-like protein [Betaproteobacteria bacterium]|jgi:tripartite-type tricarboxylate transporter receptor subunit TctC|nr:protein bugT-like protein [Betaproteobacteria bacterium]
MPSTLIPTTKDPAVRVSALLFVLLFTICEAAAQAYPAKIVRLVIPFPPSGGSDVIARIFVPKFAEALGQQVLVDNRSGANGNVGTEIVARSAPDGYTLLFNGSGTLAINPSLYEKLPYDPVRDFAPISLVVLQPHVLVVHPSVPARSVKELIALAQAQPGKLNFASSGSGSLAHLAGEMFKMMARVDMVHVPYKGAAPSLVDLVAGHVHLVFSSSPSVMPQVRTHRLRALAVTTAKRVAAMPELPTMAESGLPALIVTGWYGLLAPAGTPGNITAGLNSDIVSTLRQSDVRQKLIDLGLEIETSTPQGLGDFVKAEIAKYARVVRSANIRVD